MAESVSPCCKTEKDIDEEMFAMRMVIQAWRNHLGDGTTENHCASAQKQLTEMLLHVPHSQWDAVCKKKSDRILTIIEADIQFLRQHPPGAPFSVHKLEQHWTRHYDDQIRLSPKADPDEDVMMPHAEIIELFHFNAFFLIYSQALFERVRELLQTQTPAQLIQLANPDFYRQMDDFAWEYIAKIVVVWKLDWKESMLIYLRMAQLPEQQDTARHSYFLRCVSENVRAADQLHYVMAWFQSHSMRGTPLVVHKVKTCA